MNRTEARLMHEYLSAFAARHDAYVKDSRAHIDSPLDLEVAYAALRGKFSVSGYMARWVEAKALHPRMPDKRYCLTHIGAIDFDMENGFDLARAVRTTVKSRGVGSLLVESRRGAHLWFTTVAHDTADDSITGMAPADIIRRALLGALALTGIDDPKAEVFPKKSRSDWGVGALRMPLMKHPKNGQRYPAYSHIDDTTIDRVGPLIKEMEAIQVVSFFPSFVDLADLAPKKMPYPAPRGPRRRKPKARPGDNPTVTQLLSDLGAHFDPGRSVRCPFHDDRHASLQIAKDDERIWCKNGECEAYNEGRGIGSIELARLLKDQTLRISHRET